MTLIGDGQERQISPGADGAFEFLNLRPGLYGVDIVAEGHLPVARVVEVLPNQNDIGAIPLTPEFEAPEAAPTLRGIARLGDQQGDDANHFGITVQAFVGENLATSTQTNGAGAYVFTAGRTDYRLVFRKTGYESVELAVTWNAQANRFDVLDAPLADYQGVSLAADLSAGVTGQLSSPVAGTVWDETTTITLSGD